MLRESENRKEGQVRIPSGCAISGLFSRSGARTNGEAIIRSIAAMHDRSNGLGGGFAGYGIYPEYKDSYAFHIFMIRRPPGKNANVSSTTTSIW